MTKEFVYDFEVFPNEYFAVFKSTDKQKSFVLYNNDTGNNIAKFLLWYSFNVKTLIGWNNSSYDDHLLNSILKGKHKVKDIVEINNSVFEGKERLFFKRDKILTDRNVRFIDCMLLPKDVDGLKASGGWRCNADMVECEVDFKNASLTEEDRATALSYCEHDVDITIDIFLSDEVQTNLAIRESILQDHPNLDQIVFWTNSANLADWMIADSIEACNSFEDLDKQRKNVAYSKPNVFTFNAMDVIPSYIKFNNARNKAALDEMLKIVKQDALTFKPNYTFEINGKPYKFGQGGLHFCEGSGVFTKVTEIDVDSFYPSLIRNLQIVPSKVDPSFSAYYSQSIDDRLKFKMLANTSTNKVESTQFKVKSDSLKLMLNTIYGQLKTKGKYVYSPVDSLRITITGQLIMLMLCESLNEQGIKVLIGNTDGLFVDNDLSDDLVKSFEDKFNLKFSREDYKTLIIRDVNAIYGISNKGKIKANGVFVAKKMSTPKIIYNAAVKHLLEGIDILEYIKSVADLQQFEEIKKLNKNETAENGLNKVNRYYRSVTGIKIPSGADKVTITNKKLAALPSDIDYDWYVKEIQDAVDNINNVVKPKAGRIVLSEFDKDKKGLKAAGVPFIVPKARQSGGTVRKSSIVGWNDEEVLKKYFEDITVDTMEGCCGFGFATGSLTKIITIDVDDYNEARKAGLFKLLNGGLITHHTDLDAKQLKEGNANCSFSFLYEGKLKTHSKIKGYELFYNDKEGKPSKIIQATGPHQHKDTGAITQYKFTGKLVKLPKALEKFLEKNAPLNESLFEQESVREEKEYEPIDENDLSNALEIISKTEPVLSYEDWRNIAFATAHSSDVDSATAFMKYYWPENKDGEYENLFKSWDYSKSHTFAYLKNRLNSYVEKKSFLLTVANKMNVDLGKVKEQSKQEITESKEDDLFFFDHTEFKLPVEVKSKEDLLALAVVKKQLCDLRSLAKDLDQDFAVSIYSKQVEEFSNAIDEAYGDLLDVYKVDPTKLHQMSSPSSQMKWRKYK